jgi:hypothetical protein
VARALAFVAEAARPGVSLRELGALAAERDGPVVLTAP